MMLPPARAWAGAGAWSAGGRPPGGEGPALPPAEIIPAMKKPLFFLGFAAAGLVLASQTAPAGAAEPSLAAAPEAKPACRTFLVRQTSTLRDIPSGAKQIRLWLTLPDDDPAQRVLNLAVASAPGSWRLVREPGHGNRFFYTEVDRPGVETLTTVLEFAVRRQAVFYDLNPARAGLLSESQRRLFAEELRADAPHMEVTGTIREMARQICGAETNPVVEVRQLLDYVTAHTDHYSKDPSKPNCGVGDAANCLAHGGGCCTDIHSLFIALARARGIPARLQMGYRLQPRNQGIEADPGYRCWPEYFIAGCGWVPADAVEADAAEATSRPRWLSGLSEFRVHLNEGRNFELSPRQEGGPVNTMIIGYAEIDGVPARVLPEGDQRPQLARTVKWVERTEAGGALLSQAGGR
jgi:transglutaminase-like putative cysteine protease